MTTTTSTLDYDAIKQRQQASWSAGDYAVIGTTLQIIGETLCESADLAAGWRVVDLAAGNGNAALAAARRGCEVTAVDYVPALLERLTTRAEADGLVVETKVADAEATGLPDAGFDAVLSTLGIMFTPNQERAADEIARLCRPGGRIGLASWTPGSFVGDMFRTIGRHVPPPAGVPSPMLWGSEDHVRSLFGDRVTSVAAVERDFVFRYRSAGDLLDAFRSFYGPMVKAFDALGDEGATLADELVALADEHNTATDGTLRLPSAYLEVVAVRS
jgi:SAM-dependent methyltransferase